MNVASTVSRNAILWPLASPQHLWWLLWVHIVLYEFSVCSVDSAHILCTDNDAVPVIFLTVVFIAGSGMYYKAEPQGNIMLDVCKCIGVSLVHTIYIRAFFLMLLEEEFVKNTFLPLFFSLPLKTASRTAAANTQRGSTGWTGQRKNMM